MKIFRFDDICINTNMKETNKMAALLKERFKDCRVLFCISPLVHDMSEQEGNKAERIYPKIFNAYSDYRKFYTVDLCGLPEIIPPAERASHALVHVDHRLLPHAAQEMSILVSCSLSKSKVFVPPFNKWNNDTEDICEEHNIDLVKFEDGWLCCEYNDFDSSHDLWYLHSREFTYEKFEEWLQ